jgi:hypothetical protein
MPMPHKDATAQEIRAEIQRRIWDTVSLDIDSRESDVPTPEPMDVLNVGGSHWTVDLMPSVIPECNKMVLNIVRNVMSEYELRDWWQWGVIVQSFAIRRAAVDR